MRACALTSSVRFTRTMSHFLHFLRGHMYSRTQITKVLDPRVPSYALNCSVMINTPALQRSVTLVRLVSQTVSPLHSHSERGAAGAIANNGVLCRGTQVGQH